MMKYVVLFFRMLVGALFIFSGFIKANDPLGFSYKLNEYFEVFSMPWASHFSVVLAIGICWLEVLLGFFILLGFYRLLTLWTISILMVFFTFLTFYSAYYNKVTSCGCFGDAIKLTPWQSFSKDVALDAFILLLVIGRKYFTSLFSAAQTLWVTTVLGLFILTFPLYTYAYLPVIDFRPYKVGSNWYVASPEHIRQKFFYTMRHAVSGKVQEFDKYPTDTAWHYVSNRTEPMNKSIKPIEHFEMQDAYGVDKRDSLITMHRPTLFVVAYDLSSTNREAWHKLEHLVKEFAVKNISVVALTSSSPASIAAFKKESLTSVPIYQSPDDVPLKAMIRSNPGLILMQDSVVRGMWPCLRLPSVDDLTGIAP